MSNVSERAALREANKNPSLRNEPRELKSDLKKGTAFAKKIRTFAAEHEGPMLAELRTYNLKMFVKETAQGIGAALYEAPKPLKTQDVVALTSLCSALHQRYDEFLTEALASIKKSFDMKPLLAEMEKKLEASIAANVPGQPAPPNAASVEINRLRAAVRFMCEWWLSGLLPDAKFIIGVLALMASALDKGAKQAPPQGAASDGNESVPAHITSNVLTFVNMIVRTVGIELMGSSKEGLQVVGHGACRLSWSEADNQMGVVDDVSKASATEQCNGRRECSLVQSNTFSTEAERVEFSRRVNAIGDHAIQFCTKLKKGVEARWRQMCEQAELRGDPPQEVKDQFQALRRECDKIYVLTENLLSSISRDADLPPQVDLAAALQKSQVDAQLTFTSGVADFFNVKVAETMNYYDDDDQRSFYEELAPIDNLIPPMEDDGRGLPLTQQQLSKQQAQSAQLQDAAATLLFMDTANDHHIQALDGLTRGSAALPAAQRKLMDYSKIDDLLVALHRCSSINTADAWIVEFLAEATKYFFPDRLPADVDRVRPSQARNFFLNSKMMLVVELRYEPERAQELIPFLARVAATLHARFPEVGESLGRQLENHVQDAIRSKRSNAFHAKLLNARYLCELVKFRAVPPIRLIRILHLAIDTFDEEASVQMCAIMLEHGVSFLLRGGVTRTKAEDCLKRMKEAAAAKGIPTRAEVAYESAWAELRRVMNPQAINRKRITRQQTPLEQFVRHLLFEKLPAASDDASFRTVLDLIMTLPWHDSAFPSDIAAEERWATRTMLIKTFRKAHRLTYDGLHSLVRVIEAVTRAHGSSALLHPLVDYLVEDIRRDLEVAPTFTPTASSSAAAISPNTPTCMGSPGIRSMQKRLQDMKFISELYRQHLISFRMITFTCVMLLAYYPTGPIPPLDYSRLRCALQLLRLCGPHFLRHQKPHMKQMARYLTSLLCCHLYTRRLPLPMDLDYQMEETLIELSISYDDAIPRHRGGRDRRARPPPTETPKRYFLDRFPRTPPMAVKQMEACRDETVLEDNGYFFVILEGFARSKLNRCLPVLAKSSAAVAAALAPGNTVDDGLLSAEGDASSSSSSGSSSDSEGSSDSDDDSSSSDSGSGGSSSSSSSSSYSSGDDEEDDDDEDEEDDDNSSDSTSSSSSSSSSEEEEEPKLGPLANARFMSQRTPIQRSTCEDDIDFDNLLRDVLRDSATEGTKRTQNKTTQQLEKMVESRLTVAKSTSRQQQQQLNKDADGDSAATRVLESHQRLMQEQYGSRKKKPSEAPESSTGGDGAAATPMQSAVRVSVLRRAPAAGSGGAQPAAAVARPTVEARSIYIPMDSEFARRSQTLVSEAQRERAIVQEHTRMLQRQHEEEEARSSIPNRFARR